MPPKKVPRQEERCQKKREDGQQCRAARLKGQEYCLFHHPWTERQRERFEAGVELPLQEKTEIHKLLVEAVRGVKSGKMKAQQAYALGWLMRLLRENLPGVQEELARFEKEGLLRESEPEFGGVTEGRAEEKAEEEEVAEAE